ADPGEAGCLGGADEVGDRVRHGARVSRFGRFGHRIFMTARAVPSSRVRRVNDAPIRGDGEYVLYWMIAARRTRWSHGLDRAVEHARALGVPLLVLEALRVGYPWASDRLHRFVLDGMVDNAARFEER